MSVPISSFLFLSGAPVLFICFPCEELTPHLPNLDYQQLAACFYEPKFLPFALLEQAEPVKFEFSRPAHAQFTEIENLAASTLL